MKKNKIINHKEIWSNSLSGMATGFFSSLIISYMFSIIGMSFNDGENVFIQMRRMITYMTPAFIGLTIGWKNKSNLFETIAIIIASQIVAHSLVVPNFNKIDIKSIKETNGILSWSNISYFKSLSEIKGIGIDIKTIAGPGDVFASLLVSIGILYLFNLFRIKNSFDFIILPFLGIIIGLICMFFVTYCTQMIIGAVGAIIKPIQFSETWVKIAVSPIIAIIMGLMLSLPAVSSAALALMLNISGIVASISLAGTVSQMVSFAILTYFANGSKSETLAVGIGTSMFQSKNFIKKPILIVIPIICSGLSGLFVALFCQDIFEQISYKLSDNFYLENFKNSISSGKTITDLYSDGLIVYSSGVINNSDPLAGMGAAALYGPIFTIYYSVIDSNVLQYLLHLFLAQILIPLFITIILGIYSFKKGILKSQDFKLWAKEDEINKSIANKISKKIKIEKEVK